MRQPINYYIKNDSLNHRDANDGNRTMKLGKNNKTNQKNSDRSTINIHFTFESGPMLQFNRELRHLWEKYYVYPGSLMNNVRLQIGTHSNKRR